MTTLRPMMNLYDEACFECSKLITKKYSTSFSLGIRTFDKSFRYPIYAIYGFVRYADEIVDTFHDYDQQQLIDRFGSETFCAIKEGISTNPVIHSFQQVVNQYHIDHELIRAFLRSMAMDLDNKAYDKDTYQTYIYGSAEVIGLMCLRIFTSDDALYQSLIPKARSLGAAFQKVNFLRDVKADYTERGRTYFPGIDFNNFTEQDKLAIEAEIKHDFDEAFEGIKRLPAGTRLGVYIAYIYYLQLFKKISYTSANVILKKRIRVSDARKMSLYIKAVLQQKLNVI
ncbi:phytoene/squalene synthase family protein [Mucilaginibacter sp. SMC90]|uniref:phytoene/squalene synthase family protein n=1 Tax=Mucilaginibacter sp. SMC90 TaxID=2929803 RepID=UPI001FB3F7EE|nr:phytoene/squalene synthase family protein [Mucilaginibacter sp. SMC90]UOE50592.1 phytoene/squalene synthase family protein [Mucilaginibacter sp. SMC90]